MSFMDELRKLTQPYEDEDDYYEGADASAQQAIPSDAQLDFENAFGGAVDYVTEVNSAMNLTVVLQMLGVGLLLTLVASAASVLFIMRYDPLKILANRD